MPFANTRRLVDAELGGASVTGFWRKVPSQVTTAGLWFDLSMSPGNPSPQYYAAAPLLSQPLSTADGGIIHGGPVSPRTKHLVRTMQLSPGITTPMPMILCDYLMFYPFVDEGTTDEQPMVNVGPLPRFSDGKGVEIMAISVAGRTGGQQFKVKYTNSDGVAGRETAWVIENSAAAIGTIVTSATATNLAAGPFLPLAPGDSGVRSIESVTMLGVDVGLFTLVLVKPLFTTQIVQATAPVETDAKAFPLIADGAYLNWLCLPSQSLSGVSLIGSLTTVWN